MPEQTETPTSRRITPDVLADVTDAAALGPVPAGTNTRTAVDDRPDVYADGCHVPWGSTHPHQPCLYGDTTASTTIAVFGDSHAAAWAGAFDEAGKANGWKILMVTKSGCPAADITVYSSAEGQRDTVYTACDQWRDAAISFINDNDVALVVLPTLSRRGGVGYRGGGALNQWQLGLGRTIDAVRSDQTDVLVIGDVPYMGNVHIPACVLGNTADVSACAQDRSQAVKTDRIDAIADAATGHHATFVDVSNWFCTDHVCPAVIGNIVVYRDEHHLTDSFSRYRSTQIADIVNAATGSRPERTAPGQAKLEPRPVAGVH